jgi:hypothetical protein
MELKQSVGISVPVRLRAVVDGSPLAAVTYQQATVYLQKHGGAAVQKVLGPADWVEVDGVNMPGEYDLVLQNTDVDTLGFLKYSVTYIGISTYYFGLMQVVSNLEADTFGRLGAPAGASVSADIAAIEAHAVAIDAKTTNLPAVPASQGDVTSSTATLAADLAAAVTSIKGAGNKDITQVDTAVAAVKVDTAAIALKTTNLPAVPAAQGDVTAAVTSIKGAGNKDITQVDTAVAAVGVNVVELLGLLHKNAVLDGQTYNAGGRLTGGTLYVYDTAAHASLNDHVTGLLHSYTIFATYDLADHQTLYRLTLLS